MAEHVGKPKVRFAGFTEVWEQRKLGDLAEFNPKAELPTNFEYVDLESVVGTELINHRTQTKYTAPSRAQRLAQYGDLFYQLVRPYQKNNYLFELNSENFVFSTGYAQLRPSVDGYFLMSLVQNEYFVQKVLDNCTGTSYPAINVNDLAEINVYTSLKKSEQARIGTFFRQLDRLITLHQRKRGRLENIKKAMLEKMFPKNGADVPEVRFAGFTEAWEQRKLGEIADIVGGGTPSTSNPSYWNGDIDWYAPAEIGEQIFLTGSQKKITANGLQKCSAALLPVGTVLFTSRAGIGNTAILAKQAATNQGFQSIVPDFKIADSYFIFSRTHELKKFAEIVGAGSTFTEVSGKQMSRIPILMPKLDEQARIGTFFRHLDRLITLHQRKVELLQNIKKACLEAMFA